MIFVYLHYFGSVPSSSDAWKRSRIRYLTVGQVVFYTMAGKPSLPSAFQDFVASNCRSISSMVMAGISTGALWDLVPSSSMLSGSGRKNLVSSSSACFLWLLVNVLSALRRCGIFPKTVSFSDFKYLAVFQILLLSARNVFQCFFFCFWIALWYCFAVFAAMFSSCGTFRPVCHSERAWFLQYIYIWRSCVRSAIHYCFVYSDSLAFGIKIYTASETADISRSVFCCTESFSGVLYKVLPIRILISFYSVFFRSSRSGCVEAVQDVSKTVSMIMWSELYSVLWTAYLIIESVRFSETRTRSIVDSQSLEYSPLYYILMPYLSKLLNPNSFIRSIIGSVLPCLAKNILSFPHNWS